jgi:integrase/recombinase XerD
MSLGKQAKVLSKGQTDAVLGHLSRTRHSVRNRVIFLLSVRAGLRAKEVASLTWGMVCDPGGEVGQALFLEDRASKGRSGRVIPLNRELRAALISLRSTSGRRGSADAIVGTERSPRTSAQVVVNLFSRWYRDLGFVGCSSHSGRRTFITNAARKISTVGGSLRDVQMLAGHTNLSTTQRYIEGHGEAQKRIVELV